MKLAMKVYVSKIEDTSRRERPLKRWKDRMKEYMHERADSREDGVEQAMRKCMARKRWRLFFHGYTIGDIPRENKVSNYIDIN